MAARAHCKRGGHKRTFQLNLTFFPDCKTRAESVPRQPILSEQLARLRDGRDKGFVLQPAPKDFRPLHWYLAALLFECHHLL
jgi:hypothetical protein